LQRKREARKLRATPTWANEVALQAVYAEAARTGLQVDHIVPLRSPLVCGLHWEGNLQLLTAAENARKNNHWWPHMPVAAPATAA
jgi:5-methylcytosine-specific restriction endonuclease McrA